MSDETAEQFNARVHALLSQGWGLLEPDGTRLRSERDAAIEKLAKVQDNESKLFAQAARAKTERDELKALRDTLHAAMTHRDEVILEWSARAERAEAAKLDARPEVLAFAHLMESKLREHDDRPGWNDPSIGDDERDDNLRELWDRLSEEANELDDALRSYVGDEHDDLEDRRDPDYARDAVWEAVDVANFAMMIADVLGGLRTAESTDG